jgi:hypothetical protein
MSVASSIINSINIAKPWVVGQSPIGAILTIGLPTTNVTSNVGVTELQSLCEGVWAITSQYTTESTADGTTIELISVTIDTAAAGQQPYTQDFYYNNIVLDNTETLDMFTTAIVPVTNAENPLQISYVLVWAVGASDPTVTGTITCIRIA